MPLIDMPLEKLLAYHGTNERPEDIDAFWDEGIREMEAMGTDYELVPAGMDIPNVECYHLYFTGVGGSRIHCHFLKPAHIQGKIPAIAFFHGYAGHRQDFFDHVAWAGLGMCCAAMDCRGQGGQSEDLSSVRGNTLHGHIIRGLEENDPKKLYYRNTFLDTAQLVRILQHMDFVNETKIGAYGGSQGGGLTLACASLCPTLNRAASQYPFLSDYRRVWDMDLDVGAYSELREYFRLYDPLHEKEKETFSLLGYIDIHNMTHRVKAKVRMFTGLMDTICPPSTQFAAYNAIPSEKDYVIYPDYGHEKLHKSPDNIMQFMCEMLK
ncbi:MAG: acetylxylan esterase [Clostridia bacterium]|nr:acetylxylan esterase [Clostridia bacterium]